jgi:hypothetical protein
MKNEEEDDDRNNDGETLDSQIVQDLASDSPSIKEVLEHKQETRVIVIGNSKGFTGTQILKMRNNKDCRPTRVADNQELKLSENPISSFLSKRRQIEKENMYNNLTLKC